MCGNEDHDEPRPAIYRIQFTDRRWNTTTACHDCVAIILENMLGEPLEVLFTLAQAVEGA